MLCTNCGTIWHRDDGSHTCDPADLPSVGKPKKPVMVEVVK